MQILTRGERSVLKRQPALGTRADDVALDGQRAAREMLLSLLAQPAVLSETADELHVGRHATLGFCPPEDQGCLHALARMLLVAVGVHIYLQHMDRPHVAPPLPGADRPQA